LRFVYSLFYQDLPKQFWIISLAAFGLGAVVIYKPVENFEFFSIVHMVITIEIIRVIVLAFLKKKEGTWIIGMAFLMFFLFGALDVLMDAGILVSLREMENPYALGSIGFFIAMSLYLSRDIARSNKKIVEQEMEQKLLEAENARQSKELEEARQLQLSMLPKELPQHPHLEIGVFMKTATEVGGDYYDFKLHDDGTLTAVIGDATGHGMQAGTMVSATKSLFHALADEPAPVQFLKKSTEAIKAMGLKKMYMALSIAKFKDHHMHIAAAGMPFPLIYRSSTGQVEEVALKGMPLGGFANFPYKDKKFHLNQGDTVLFMSDGFEEMFNPQDEMLGVEQVKVLFKEIAANSPEEIIEHLKKAGEEWANGRDQEDDVTFVVIKIK
jgi:serine phosphatase RsbU (regulator of sigma subunit)